MKQDTVRRMIVAVVSGLILAVSTQVVGLSGLQLSNNDNHNLRCGHSVGGTTSLAAGSPAGSQVDKNGWPFASEYLYECDTGAPLHSFDRLSFLLNAAVYASLVAIILVPQIRSVITKPSR